MSSTAIDGLGPSVNSQDRNAARIAAAITGAALLAIVFSISPDRQQVRCVLSIAGIALIARAVTNCTRLAPTPAAAPEACTCGALAALLELELTLLDHRASCDDTNADVSERVDRITRMVAELVDQER